MPAKTNSELIRELSTQTTILATNQDNDRKEIERLDSESNRLIESLAALTIRVVVLEQHVGELRKTAEEKGRRWWALLPPLVAAIVGGIIALLGQLLLSYLLK